MRLQLPLPLGWVLVSSLLLVTAASSWGFDDATVSVQGKKAGVGGGLKEKYDSSWTERGANW